MKVKGCVECSTIRVTCLRRGLSDGYKFDRNSHFLNCKLFSFLPHPPYIHFLLQLIHHHARLCCFCRPHLRPCCRRRHRKAHFHRKSSFKYSSRQLSLGARSLHGPLELSLRVVSIGHVLTACIANRHPFPTFTSDLTRADPPRSSPLQSKHPSSSSSLLTGRSAGHRQKQLKRPQLAARHSLTSAIGQSKSHPMSPSLAIRASSQKTRPPITLSPLLSQKPLTPRVKLW